MNENIILNHIEEAEGFMNNEENDYKNLIIRLQEIKTTIALLEKIIL